MEMGCGNIGWELARTRGFACLAFENGIVIERIPKYRDVFSREYAIIIAHNDARRQAG
jgi:hypothetical protein